MPLMVDRRLIYHFDVMTLLLLVSLVGLGITTVYSATYDPQLEGLHPIAVRQAMWGGVGLAAALVMVSFDYRRLEMYAPALYALGILLLLAVPVFGTIGNGSRR